MRVPLRPFLTNFNSLHSVIRTYLLGEIFGHAVSADQDLHCPRGELPGSSQKRGHR